MTIAGNLFSLRLTGEFNMAGETKGSASIPEAEAAGIVWWRIVTPIAIAIVIALIPAPVGLGQHAWNYFALFAGVVAALVLEPLPTTAVGFVAITLTAVLSRWTLFSDAELAKPGFNVAGETVKWAFSGFASSTVWLVGGAFMLALGYQKMGWDAASRCYWCGHSERARCRSVTPPPLPTLSWPRSRPRIRRVALAPCSR